MTRLRWKTVLLWVLLVIVLGCIILATGVATEWSP